MSLEGKQAKGDTDKDQEKLKRIVDYDIVPEMEQILHKNVKYISKCLDSLEGIDDLNSDPKKNDEEEKKQEGKGLDVVNEDKELDIAMRVK